MIGMLSGCIIAKTPPQIIIDVNGVGYEVSVPMSTFYNLPDLGVKAKLFIQMIVREDAQLLFGFLHASEKKLFNTLIKISGLGPKLALAILSGISAAELITCVLSADVVRLTKLPGVGKKTAERMVVELSDKFKEWDDVDVKANDIQVDPQFLAPGSQARSEALQALLSLGYKENEARKALAKLPQSEASCEVLIKQALQGLAT